MQFGFFTLAAENLGHFRLLVGDPGTVDRTQIGIAAMKLDDSWAKLAAAYAVNGRSDVTSQYFTKARKLAESYEARKLIVELAARFDEVLSALARQQQDDAQMKLALARKLAERGKQFLAQKQPAKAQAELEKSRDISNRLRAASAWTVLKPTEMKS